MRFEPTELTTDELALQAEVRDFLDAELPRGGFEPGLGMGGDRDPAFSKTLAARGWLGMALPARYGGGERSVVERFVVVEELLRWGAPVGDHWIADRQSGPVINRFGTEELKQRFLPAICRGELTFSIGMSEPDAGSDLASVATRATSAQDGWLVNGTKIWTSGAYETTTSSCCAGRATTTTVTRAEPADRRPALDGLEVNPIPFLDGTPTSTRWS